MQNFHTLLKSSLLFLVVFTGHFCSPAQSHETENVVIITLDGFRWQELYTGADPNLIDDKKYVENTGELRAMFWDDDPIKRREKLMPFFWSVIAKEGQLHGNRNLGSKVNCTNQMWFSYPGYSEILTGHADDARIKSNDKINNPNQTVLEFVNNLPTYKGKVGAFGSWDVFPYIINAERSGIPVNAGFMKATQEPLTAQEKLLNKLEFEIPGPWGGVRLDGFTHYFAEEYVKKNKPRLLYISYGETDDWAHEGHYDAYLKSAHQTDAFIGQLWNLLQSMKQYKGKTTFIITTDHGRGTEPKDTWRSHGTKIGNAGQIWMALLGPDIPAEGEVTAEEQLYQNQVAKTAAYLLGIDYTSSPAPGEVLPVFK